MTDGDCPRTLPWFSWASLRRGLIQRLPRPASGADERLTLAARRDEVAVRHLRAIERAVTERQRLRRNRLKRRFRLHFRREVLQTDVRQDRVMVPDEAQRAACGRRRQGPVRQSSPSP